MCLPGPDELYDGVPGPGLDPVLGGGLHHCLRAGVGPGVRIVSPSPLPLTHSPTELMAANPQFVSLTLLLMLVTSVPMSPVSPEVTFTLAISPRPVSPSGSVSQVASAPPAPLSLDLLEEEAQGAEQEQQPHDTVWRFITDRFEFTINRCQELRRHSLRLVIMSFYLNLKIISILTSSNSATLSAKTIYISTELNQHHNVTVQETLKHFLEGPDAQSPVHPLLDSPETE